MVDYNKINKEDSVDVINEKLQTEMYVNMDNAEIAHMLTDIGCNIDFGMYRVSDKQVVRR